MTCISWFLFQLWFLRGASPPLKDIFLISSMCLFLLPKFCQLAWTYISVLPTFSSLTLDPLLSPLLENSKVTFGSTYIFVVVIYYFLIPLSLWSFIYQILSFALLGLLILPYDSALFFFCLQYPLEDPFKSLWWRISILLIKVFDLCWLLKAFFRTSLKICYSSFMVS